MKKAALIISLSMIAINTPVLGMDAAEIDTKSPEEICFAAINKIRSFIEADNTQKTLDSLDGETVAPIIEKNQDAKELLQAFPEKYLDDLPKILGMPHHKGHFTEDFVPKYTKICKILKEAKHALSLKEGDLKALAEKFTVKVNEDAVASNAPNSSLSSAIAVPTLTQKRHCCFAW
ncbi:hypothetical protein [Candidatus Finniella inopinata]|uniref:Uncharacterized protein n=1 Tax=Candidatus Finniella inopinata TaxID=1696036 RepID=A0A4Q7DL39_9PROT|nr:hypothetical protein [Candidatus Finniella inopinata]RZI46864.1 hypothetical protein EQU50_01170 [Candidatus Finniella inopinata]